MVETGNIVKNSVGQSEVWLWHRTSTAAGEADKQAQKYLLTVIITDGHSVR